MQALFEKVAAKIQEICPFNDDDWDFSVSDIQEDDDKIHEVDGSLVSELSEDSIKIEFILEE